MSQGARALTHRLNSSHTLMETAEAGSGRSWQEPESECTLRQDEVHLWRVHLNLSDGASRQFNDVLSADELARAERFRFPDLRRKFVVGRGALRMILARYLSVPPQMLAFSYSRHGKPALSTPAQDLQFNVSHSHDLLVVATCWHWPLGVDIEKVDPRFHAMEIAQRYFTPRESRKIARLDGPAGLRAFFQFWTAKEAVLKASSLGLNLELSKLEIALTPLRIVALEDSATFHGATWHLAAFAPAQDYSGALAVAIEPTRIKYWDFIRSVDLC